MKKISILSLHLGFGGIEKSIIALANLLCERYEVEIACCYKIYDEPSFKLNSNVKVKYLMGEHKPNRDAWKESIKKKNVVKFFKEWGYGLKVLNLRRSSMINYIKNCDSDVIISTRDIFNEWLSLYGKQQTLKIGWEHNHFHDNYTYASNIVNSAKMLDYLVLVSSDLQKFYSKELHRAKCVSIYIPRH